MRGGVEGNYGNCLCVRFKLAVQVAEGQWEVRSFRIESDGLLRLEERKTFWRQYTASHFIHIGEADVFHGRFGAGFSGLTIGRDLDLGQEALFDIGARAVASIVRKGNLDFRAQSGVEYESQDFGGSNIKSRVFLPQTLELRLNNGRIHAKAKAQVSVQPSEIAGEGKLRYLGELYFGARIRKKGVVPEFGLDFSALKDPERSKWGHPGDIYRCLLYFELSYAK